MNNKLNKTNNQKAYEDEIDLANLIKFFIRNKKLIFLTTIIFFITSCIYGLLTKRVWEGKFEIVLEKEEPAPSLNQILGGASNNNLIQKLSDLGGGGVSLNTEVGILQSPSILLPIYDYINQEKKKSNKDYIPITFEKWKKKTLEIELMPRTSILNISYKDSDKKLILPVLSKISNAYQDYSGRRSKRKINLAKNYFTDQIKEYKVKSSKSLREVQEYAYDKDLTMLNLKTFDLNNDGIVDDFEKGEKNQSNILLERIRLQSLNNIRNIDKQIEQLNILENTDDQLAYIVNNIEFLKKDKIFKKINEIDEALFIAKSKYTEKDRTVIQLVEKRRISLKILKERAIGNLQALRTIEKAKMDSVTRPKEVILNYKNLLRTAARDEKTLIELENQLRFINLEQAKYKDPWELITQPTLDESPVAPNRKLIAVFGTILGFVTGTFLSFIKDKKDYFLDIT